MWHITILYFTIKYYFKKSIQYNTILCNIIQYYANTIQQCHSIPYNTIQYHAIPYTKVQYYAIVIILCKTYNTIQYNTILPLYSVKYVCLISQETNGTIRNPKTVLKSVLWRGSESALTFCKLQKTTLNQGVTWFQICLCIL